MLGKLVCKKLDILYETVEDKKEIVIEYVYDKYIKNGYFIRGLSRPDYKNIIDTKVNKSARLSYVDSNEIEFTTDISKACIKSINSPKYLFNMVANNKYVDNKDVYYYKKKDDCVNNFKMFLDGLGVDKNEKKDILELFVILWDYFNREDNNIYLAFMK